MEKLFFELLQVAVGSRHSLSQVPSAREWGELYTMAAKQALIGVCFVGLQKLSNDNDDDTLRYDDCRPDGSINHTPSTINLPEALRLRWLGMAAKIQQRNQVMTEECVRLSKQLAHGGFHCCILKGQSNLAYYPEDLREYRTAGDIDVLLRHKDDLGSIALPIRYCLGQATMRGKRAHVTYHHADLFWDGQTEVEVHYRATFLCSPLRSWRLQRWFRDNEQWGLEDAKIDGCVFPVATVSFNAVYQLLHINKHLFEEGIGLRQLLDYYFVLRALHIDQGEFFNRTQSMAQRAEGMGIVVKSNEEIMQTLSRFGMRKFTGAVMWVLAQVFAIPNEYLICKPNEKEGKFLLNEIMMAGNFGKYDERINHNGGQFSHAIEKTKHNLRLLTHYPEEVLWEPFFRVYHWIWRRFELWRY